MTIEKTLFERRISFTSVQLPSTVESIEEKAFYRIGVTDTNIEVKTFEYKVPEFIKKIGIQRN